MMGELGTPKKVRNKKADPRHLSDPIKPIEVKKSNCYHCVAYIFTLG